MKRILKMLHRFCDNWTLVRRLHCGIIDSVRLTADPSCAQEACCAYLNFLKQSSFSIDTTEHSSNFDDPSVSL
jgi:hypothetical protein